MDHFYLIENQCFSTKKTTNIHYIFSYPKKFNVKWEFAATDQNEENIERNM